MVVSGGGTLGSGVEQNQGCSCWGLPVRNGFFLVKRSSGIQYDPRLAHGGSMKSVVRVLKLLTQQWPLGHSVGALVQKHPSS